MIKLFDSELKIMEVIWQHGDITAKEISKILEEKIGWNKNTTYTVIKKCVEKGAIKRLEPKFICHALVSKEEIQTAEVDDLVDKLFDGSSDLLFASLVGRKKLSKSITDKLKAIVSELGGNGT